MALIRKCSFVMLKKSHLARSQPTTGQRNGNIVTLWAMPAQIVAKTTPQTVMLTRQAFTNTAWQFKYYKDHSNDYRYALGWNDIRYSPNVACGTKRVYI